MLRLAARAFGVDDHLARDLAEFVGAVFGEQVAVAAPHEQAWHAQSSRCGVQGFGVSGADQARGAVDELWVPVPAVATVVAEAKV